MSAHAFLFVKDTAAVESSKALAEKVGNEYRGKIMLVLMDWSKVSRVQDP
jgi:hypothetical protein